MDEYDKKIAEYDKKIAEIKADTERIKEAQKESNDYFNSMMKKFHEDYQNATSVEERREILKNQADLIRQLHVLTTKYNPLDKNTCIGK